MSGNEVAVAFRFGCERLLANSASDTMLVDEVMLQRHFGEEYRPAIIAGEHVMGAPIMSISVELLRELTFDLIVAYDAAVVVLPKHVKPPFRCAAQFCAANITSVRMRLRIRPMRLYFLI